MIAALTALAAAGLWGTSDFLGGLFSRGRSAVIVLGVAQAAGLVAIALVMVVWAGPFPGTAILAPSLLAGSVGLGVLALYRALAIGPMSVVAPLGALAAVVPVVVGIAGGDRVSVLQVVGMAAAVVGCFLAARAPSDEPAPAPGSRAGIAYALVAALLIGLGFVGLEDAADEDVLWGLGLSRAVAVVALVVATIVVAVRGTPVAGQIAPLAPLVVVGLLDMSANGLFAYASTLGLLSVTSVLSSVYPVATVLLARVVLHERMVRPQVAGVVIAFGGIALLAAG